MYNMHCICQRAAFCLHTGDLVHFQSLVFFKLLIFMVNDSLFLSLLFVWQEMKIYLHTFIETRLCCLVCCLVAVWSVGQTAKGMWAAASRQGEHWVCDVKVAGSNPNSSWGSLQSMIVSQFNAGFRLHPFFFTELQVRHYEQHLFTLHVVIVCMKVRIRAANNKVLFPLISILIRTIGL